MELFEEKYQERERIAETYSGPEDEDDITPLDDEEDSDFDLDADQIDDDDDIVASNVDPEDDDDDLMADDDLSQDDDFADDDDVILDDDDDEEDIVLDDDDEPTTATNAPQHLDSPGTGFSSRRESRRSGPIVGHEPGTGAGGDL
jgi:hypothetical protein